MGIFIFFLLSHSPKPGILCTAVDAGDLTTAMVATALLEYQESSVIQNKNMSTADITSAWANCGKGDDERCDLKICTALVIYY